MQLSNVSSTEKSKREILKLII